MGNRVLLVNTSPLPSKRRKKTRTPAQKRATAKMLAANRKRRAALKRRKNPSKLRTTTKRKSTMARRRRTAAQKAATRKMIAANRRRRRPTTTRKRRVRRRRNPISRTAAFRTVRTGGASSRRRRNPIRRYRRRRNPVRRGMLNNLVMPALTAASGALALDVAWAYLPLPANIKTGPFKYVAKAGGAIGMAMLAEMVVSRKTAEAMGVGALTVVVHNMARDLIAQNMPTLRMDGMDGMGYYNPAVPVGGQEANMGLYVNSQPAAPVPSDMGLYVNGYSTEGGYNYS